LGGLVLVLVWYAFGLDLDSLSVSDLDLDFVLDLVDLFLFAIFATHCIRNIGSLISKIHQENQPKPTSDSYLDPLSMKLSIDLV
jgi:hypothetical protein